MADKKLSTPTKFDNWDDAITNTNDKLSNGNRRVVGLKIFRDNAGKQWFSYVVVEEEG